ncbi:MAG: tRNA adenosine(34) deaminase TadA [Acidimicrobiales bacterium]
MRIALDEARHATEHGDVPVGAIVVDPNGTIVAQRHNERELTGDPTAHAEILALRDAAGQAGTWRLDGHTLVVTLEPCAMCAGAAVNSRVATVVYGAPDMKAGACLSLMNIGGDPRLNHVFEIVDGVLAEECAELLSDFFAGLR